MEKINGEWDGYVFPAIVMETSPEKQMEKIGEDLARFRCSAEMYGIKEGRIEFDPLNFDACIDLLDVLHACETMLRMYNQDIVEACVNIMMAKNIARGYYRQKVVEE